MEHAPEDFASEANPTGVGPYFGTTLDDGLDPSDMLHVYWADGKKLKIQQTYSWLCPPPTRKPIRVKVDGQPKFVHIVQYSKRGAKVLVQDIVRKESPKAQSPKAKVTQPYGHTTNLANFGNQRNPLRIIHITLYIIAL